MSWRGRGKGSSDMIRRGSAFRAPVSSSFDPFEVPLERLGETLKLEDEDQVLLNSQRVLVNNLLSPGDDMYMRVPLGAMEGTLLTDGTGAKPLPLWKRLSSEIGWEFYPAELMTDSRSVMLGIASKKKAESGKKKVSLAALEQSEQTGDNGEGGESPKSNADNAAEEEEDDDSVGADDYMVHMDYEDEGARDDDYADEEVGGGDYGGEF
jgi:hypothetical protein